MVQVRRQRAADLELISSINTAAFAKHGGTASFDRLREEHTDIISLVAETDGKVVGHILFSPVVVDTPGGPVNGMGLGQLAVAPALQNKGLGTQLSETGLMLLRERQCPFVIVIGHATYYPRFGFENASENGFVCQWKGIPDANFMVLFLDEQSRSSLSGVARFEGL
jgi:putative acetyltransferase